MDKLLIEELSKNDIRTICEALDNEFIDYEWEDSLTVNDTDTEEAIEIIKNLGYSVEVL